MIGLIALLVIVSTIFLISLAYERHTIYLVIADAREVDVAKIKKSFPFVKIIVTGIGPHRLALALQNFKFKSSDIVINVGTVGSTVLKPGTAFFPTNIYSASGMKELFLSMSYNSIFGFIPRTLFSSDKFVSLDYMSDKKYHSIIDKYDSFDMEAFYLANRISKDADPDFICLKIVSDACDSTIENWEKTVENTRNQLTEYTLKLIAHAKNF